ncbi:flippase-like domain-containing protein, partial [bacterium]|nr:flippase-like domain-containing protein [bacterium]
MKTRLLATTLISLFFLYLFIFQTDLQGWLNGNSSILQAFFGHTRINWRDLWSTLGSIDLRFLGAAAILFLVSELVRAWRWQLLVLPVKRTGYHLLFAIMNIGYMANNLLPFRLGELIRAHLLGKEAGISRVSALATVVVERVLDMLGLLLLVCLTLALFRFPPDTVRPGIIAGLVVLVLLLLLALLGGIFLRRTTMRLAFALAGAFPRRWRRSILKMIDAFLDGLEILRSAGHYFSLLVSTVLLWFCYLG